MGWIPPGHIAGTAARSPPFLDNKVYLGHTAGLRTTSLSYKNKKPIRKPESEQVLVENTHEPLISKEQWDIVQDVRQHKKRTPKLGVLSCK